MAQVDQGFAKPTKENVNSRGANSYLTYFSILVFLKDQTRPVSRRRIYYSPSLNPSRALRPKV
jgi:hypothetical protein